MYLVAEGVAEGAAEGAAVGVAVGIERRLISINSYSIFCASRKNIHIIRIRWGTWQI